MPDRRERRVVETLAGLLEGIAIDDQITEAELRGLEAWMIEHARSLRQRDFRELRATIEAALKCGVLDAEAHAALLEYCRDFAAKHEAARPSAAQAFARLQGMALGVMADGRLDDEEIIDLRAWLEDYRALRSHFVFEAFFDTLDAALADGKIDPVDRARVRELCETFGAPPPPRRLPENFAPAPPLFAAPAPSPGWPELPRVHASEPPLDFFTLDLETASEEPSSVCAIGLACVRGRALAESGASFVEPPGLDFDRRHIRLHGISAKQVRGAGDFAAHWSIMGPHLAAAHLGSSHAWVLAHNASFAARCLRACLRRAELPLSGAPRLLCTLRLARRAWPAVPRHSLSALCRHLGLGDPGHDAHAGARACAALALELLRRSGAASPAELAARYGVEAIELSV